MFVRVYDTYWNGTNADTFFAHHKVLDLPFIPSVGMSWIDDKEGINSNVIKVKYNNGVISVILQCTYKNHKERRTIHESKEQNGWDEQSID